MASITCKNCGGQMEVTSKSKHSQGLGFFLIILGIISVIFIFGAPLGILLIGVGLYMCYAKDSIWLCETCKTALPRVEL